MWKKLIKFLKELFKEDPYMYHPGDKVIRFRQTDADRPRIPPAIPPSPTNYICSRCKKLQGRD